MLVDRYLHILLQNPALNVKEVLAITFTEKATAEMKQRIFNKIEEGFNKSKSLQGRLFEILNQLTEAQIFTIHGFCHHVLKRYATEAKIDPDFSILEDGNVDELLRQVYRDFLLSFQLEDHPLQSYIKIVFQEFSLNTLGDFFRFFYKNQFVLFQFLEKWRSCSPAEIQDYWKEIFITYHTPLLHHFQQHQDFWEHLESLIKVEMDSGAKSLPLQSRFRQFYDLYHQRTTDPFWQIQAIINLIQGLTKKGDGTAYSKPPGGRRDWGEEGLESFKKLSAWAAEWSQKILPYSEQAEERYASLQIGISALFSELINRCEAEKMNLNVLDFNDLQIYTLRLLLNNSRIREQLRQQYKWILVDEFQDYRSPAGIYHPLTQS